MKRVLIITYYWPPSGGGGVMRWLKMSKYFPEQGWQPVIYTPENPDPSVTDQSLVSEISESTETIRKPIWEPYNIYRRLTGKAKGEKFKAGYISEASQSSLRDRISVFIRGNFLIPDPRIFWVRSSVKYLTKYLNEKPVDLIVTTGPPHSMHLIGLGLRKKFNIPWLADFRDPWTAIDFFDKLRLTPIAEQIHRKMELRVLRGADFITTVSPGVASGLEKLAGKKVQVVNNGFDPEDFNFVSEKSDPGFVISHFGSFNLDRNPEKLWEALGEICHEIPEFAMKLRIQLIGQTHAEIIRQIIMNGMKNNLVVLPQQEHREGLKILKKSQVFLLPLNNAPNVLGILPGKMYEYLALQKPIFAIGPHGGDYEAIINETRSGVVHDFGEKQGMKDSLLSFFNLYREGKLSVDPVGTAIYSRRNLAKKMLEIPFSR